MLPSDASSRTTATSDCSLTTLLITLITLTHRGMDWLDTRCELAIAVRVRYFEQRTNALTYLYLHSCIFHLCVLCKLSFNEALLPSFSVTAARSNTSPRWALHLLPAPWWCAAPRRVSVYNKIDLTPRVRAQERGFGWQLREISGVEWSRSVSVYTTVNLEWSKITIRNAGAGKLQRFRYARS